MKNVTFITNKQNTPKELEASNHYLLDIKDSSVLVIKYPESKMLHPDTAGDYIQSKIEEHSGSVVVLTTMESILTRLRLLHVMDSISLNIIVFEECEDECNIIKHSIMLSDDGVLSDWPFDLFLKNLHDIFEMRKYKRSK